MQIPGSTDWRRELLQKLLVAVTRRLSERIEAILSKKFHKKAFKNATALLEKPNPNFSLSPRRPSDFNQLKLSECLAILEATVGTADADEILKLSGGNDHPWLQLLGWIREGLEVRDMATESEATLHAYILAASYVLIEIGSDGSDKDVQEWLNALASELEAPGEEFSLAENSLNTVLGCARKRVQAQLKEEQGEQALEWAFKQVRDKKPELLESWDNWDLPAIQMLMNATADSSSPSKIANKLNCNDSAGKLAWQTVLNARHKVAHKTNAPALKGYYRFVIYASASFVDRIQFEDESRAIVDSATKFYGDPMHSKQSPFNLITVIAVAVSTFLLGFGVANWMAPKIESRPIEQPLVVERPEPVPSPIPRPPQAKAPASSVPSDYLDSVEEPRLWTWSSGNLRFDNELLLHWNPCEGVENMTDRNKETKLATVAEMKSIAKGASVRACTYCYSIDEQKAPSPPR